MGILKNKYIYKTPQLCKAIGVSRQTLHAWEVKGVFTPPRNTHGDRVFTKAQFNKVVKAFRPGGKGYWHFKGE